MMWRRSLLRPLSGGRRLKGDDAGKKVDFVVSVMRDPIEEARDVPELLSCASKPLSANESLRFISKLGSWTGERKTHLSEFERDARFAAVCRSLGSVKVSDDLNAVLGVAADEEAARLVSDLSVHHTVKLMSNLAARKRRSTPLLRALAHNIARRPDVVEPKRCADLLYAMAALNFPDLVLADRICSDLHEGITKGEGVRSSIIGSALTSLGLLRYKHPEVFTAALEWLITNGGECRVQDIAAATVTFAALGFDVDRLSDLPSLPQSDFAKPTAYLEYIWSLCVLNRVTESGLKSVLTAEFVNTITENGVIPFSSLRRLRNVEAYASAFFPTSKIPPLNEEIYEPLQMLYSKEKRQYVDIMLNTLKSLLTSDAKLKKNCDSKMGFLYDALMVLDKNCNPYPVDQVDHPAGKNLFKVAFLALDYHDFCKNSSEPLGSISLYKRLLEAKNFRVLLVPYTEFNVTEKLMYRVQYIEKKLKELVNEERSTKKVTKSSV